MTDITNCPACDGEGFTADDDDRTPWSFWANLQPPANLAVTLGLVHKVRCERCAGTGREEGA